MVAPDEDDLIPVHALPDQQHADAFHAVIPSINIVPQENITLVSDSRY